MFNSVQKQFRNSYNLNVLHFFQFYSLQKRDKIFRQKLDKNKRAVICHYKNMHFIRKWQVVSRSLDILLPYLHLREMIFNFFFKLWEKQIEASKVAIQIIFDTFLPFLRSLLQCDILFSKETVYLYVFKSLDPEMN